MLLDEQSLKIISKNYGWDTKETTTFIGSYYDAMSQFTLNKTIEYMTKHDPEKAESINEMLLSESTQEQVKGHKILADQLQLMLASYPDLRKEIEVITKEYDHSLFFDYLKNGPVEGIEELLKYLQNKLDNFDKFLEVYKMAKERLGEEKVKQVLGQKP